MLRSEGWLRSQMVFQIDCVVAQECSKIEKTCGGSVSTDDGPSGGDNDAAKVAQCQSACDQGQFFECLDATKHSACRTKCQGDDAASRDTFSSCMGNAGSECEDVDACYAEF